MKHKLDIKNATTASGASLRLPILGLFVGLLSAHAALALTQAIAMLTGLAFDAGALLVYASVAALPAWRVLLAPTVGGVLVSLVRAMLGLHTLPGPADVMQSVRETEGRMSLRAALGNALVSVLSIGSGASLGRYGPTVHLGAGLAAAVGRSMTLSRAHSIALLGCGVAAAISATFNAPLAGVIFVHEVMLDAFARRSFVAITIASVAGAAVANAYGAGYQLVSLSGGHITHTYEYVLLAILGALGGLLAIGFVRTLDWSTTLVARLPLAQAYRPPLAGLLLGITALWFPHVIGLGDDAIHDAIEGVLPLGLLFALVAAKLFASSLCLAGGFGGGVFGPALFLGAMLGSAAGTVLELTFAEQWISPASVYAVAGMGAVISCTIGAPLTTILIVFELTSSYALTSGVMIAVVSAMLVTGWLYPYSWFAVQLSRRGVDLRAGREVRLLRSKKVAALASDDCHLLDPQISAHEALQTLSNLQIAQALVVDANQRLLGSVRLVQLMHLHEANGARPIVGLTIPPELVLAADTNLHDALRAMREQIGISVPVVENIESMRLVGVIYHSSLMQAYDDAVEQSHREERGEE